MQEDEDSNHTPAREPNSLTPSEIEFLRQDALKMHEVAEAYFARRTTRICGASRGPPLREIQAKLASIAALDQSGLWKLGKELLCPTD